MTYHYPFGGSTAGRTLQCNGWRAMSKDVPERQASIHADIGTVCHEACEALERDENLTYEKLLDLNIRCNDAVLTQELITNKVIPAYEALQDYIHEHDLARVYAEVKVQYDEDVGGTCDILAINYEETKLHAIDYKFGDGDMVRAEKNPQGYFYLWCALEDESDDGLDVSKFRHIDDCAFVIIQPSDRREDLVDVWNTTVIDVMTWAETMLDAIETAEQATPGENLITGKYCKYCPAGDSGTCAQKNGQALQALRIDAHPDSLCNTITLETALNLVDELDGWAQKVRAFAHEQIELGVELNDWKLVKKRATRKWKDEDSVTKYLKRKLKAQNAIVEKVITPAQAEKVSKTMDIKLDLKNRIVAESSGTTLVRASDKRPAVLSQVALAASLASIS